MAEPGSRGSRDDAARPEVRVTGGGVSARARRALDDLHRKELNFDLDRRDEFTATSGWHVDDHCQPLPPEPPGPPLERGSFAACRRHLERYDFADPSIVRAVYLPDVPLAERDMVLEARFYGLRFLLGLRVGGVIDRVAEVDGRRVHQWGWNYRTLEGHLEMGQMDYEARKWDDTGEVEFRIHAVSRAAAIRSPIVRLGFRLFGRRMQRRFARRALERMHALVVADLVQVSTGVRPPTVDPTVDSLDVRFGGGVARPGEG